MLEESCDEETVVVDADENEDNVWLEDKSNDDDDDDDRGYEVDR